jgi:hypothetical protein
MRSSCGKTMGRYKALTTYKRVSRKLEGKSKENFFLSVRATPRQKIRANRQIAEDLPLHSPLYGPRQPTNSTQSERIRARLPADEQSITHRSTGGRNATKRT